MAALALATGLLLVGLGPCAATIFPEGLEAYQLPQPVFYAGARPCSPVPSEENPLWKGCILRGPRGPARGLPVGENPCLFCRSSCLCGYTCREGMLPQVLQRCTSCPHSTARQPFASSQPTSAQTPTPKPIPA